MDPRWGQMAVAALLSVASPLLGVWGSGTPGQPDRSARRERTISVVGRIRRFATPIPGRLP